MARKNIHLTDADGSNEPIAPPSAQRPTLAMSPSIAKATRSSARPRGGATTIDPSLIDDTFGPRDRMEESRQLDPDLRNSILEYGQIVPGLVRPDPSNNGRYQIVYGRRRLLAIKDLNRSHPEIQFLAMVKVISDEDLVIYQGQENSNRRDLSYLERSRFAVEINDSGYNQEIAAKALSVERSTVTKMISLVRTFKPELLDAIGPAPDIGRPRLEQLSKLIEKMPELHDPLLACAQDATGTSTERFQKVLDLAVLSIKEGQGAEKKSPTLVPVGNATARLSRKTNGITVELPTKGSNGFDAWFEGNIHDILSDLHDRFEKETGET